MKKIKKMFLILFLALFLNLALFNFSLALEINYPVIPGALPPLEDISNFLDFAKYIFNFAIILAGLFAFIMIIFGGVRFLISAGNPSSIKEAKDQILSAILGLVILLSAWIILTTINPQLVILKYLEGSSSTTTDPELINLDCSEEVAGCLYPKKNYEGVPVVINLGSESFLSGDEFRSIKINPGGVILLISDNDYRICFTSDYPDLKDCVLEKKVFNDRKWSDYIAFYKSVSLNECPIPEKTLDVNGDPTGAECK